MYKKGDIDSLLTMHVMIEESGEVDREIALRLCDSDDIEQLLEGKVESRGKDRLSNRRNDAHLCAESPLVLSFTSSTSLLITGTRCSGSACAPSSAIDKLQEIPMRFSWYTPEMSYYPTEFGSETMKPILTRLRHTFQPTENKIIVEYKEHTVESEESWSGLNLQEPVMHKWYAMETEDFVVGRRKNQLFEAKLRLSKDRQANTR